MNRDTLMRAMRVGLLVAAAGAGVACEDKGLMAPSAAHGKAVMQVTITANQQVGGFGPHFLIAAAGFNGEGNDDGGFLGASVIPFTTGTHTLTVPVNLAPCLAYFADKGVNGCKVLIGAAIVPDTLFLPDTTSEGDPFNKAFDYYLAGPFLVGPAGALPTVPPIDLSVSRFGVVAWEEDDALRLGGGVGIDFGQSSVLSTVAPLAGAVSGTSAPVLFALGRGVDNSALTGINLPPIGQTLQQYPLLQVFENGKWKRVVATSAQPIGPNNPTGFNDVSAISATEAYISAQDGLFKYDGASLAKVAAVTGSTFSVATTVVGAAKYVAAGASGGVWIGNGTTMTLGTIPGGARIDGVCITGPTEAFASSSEGGGLFRWDGTSWTSVPASATANKLDLACPGPGQAYVLAQSSSILKWTGTGWQTMPTTGIGSTRLIRWGVVSANEIYAYADSGSTDRAFYKFNGTSWTEVGRSRFAQQGGRPWADPRGGAAYLLSPFGRIEKITPTGYQVIAYTPSIRDLSMPTQTSAFAVGGNLFLARWDGAKWTVDPPPAGTRTVSILNGVWSDGPKNAWAVGTSSTILHWDGGSWGVVSDFNQPVTGTSDAYNGVWGSGTDVWITGGAGVLRCKAVNACGLESGTSGSALYSIWGSGPTNIIAVGFGGRIIRYNGTSWSAMSAPTSRALLRVSGTGPSDVWAAGDSVLLHYDGTSWTVPAVNSELQNLLQGSVGTTNPVWVGLWARAPKEVYFGSRNGSIGRWDGTQWNQITPGVFLGRPVTAIAGPPGGCGMAVGFAEFQSLRPVMRRGLGPTGCMSSPMVPPTSWP
jgi:hypothetical protein